MISATSLPIALKSCCDHFCRSMRQNCGCWLVEDCGSLHEAAQTAATLSMLHLQIHQLSRRHHVVVQICHDQKRSDHDQGDDQHTERQRHHVVGVVRARGDVQEKHQVNTH